MMCEHGNMNFWGWIWLLAGVLFLVADFGWWNWGVSWYTVLFLVMGLSHVFMCGGKKKK